MPSDFPTIGELDKEPPARKLRGFAAATPEQRQEWQKKAKTAREARKLVDDKEPESKRGVYAEIERGISDMSLLAGGAMMTFLPVTGTAFMLRAQYAGRLAVKLARKDPRVFQAFVILLKYAVWAEAASFLAVITLAIGVDMQRIPVNSPVAQRFLKDEIKEVLDQLGANAAASPNGGGAASTWQPAGAPSVMGQPPGVP